MTKKITISVDEEIKDSLTALARKRKKTVSGLISELVARERRKEKDFSGKNLGVLLRTHKNILKEDTGKEYKDLLGKILDEKYSTQS